MKLTTVVKLNTSEEEHAALVETLRTCNATCDRISRIAFETREFRKFDLQKLVYHAVKSDTGLNANHVIRAIAKVSNAYKAGDDVLHTFQPTGAIELDKDLLTWKAEDQIVRINTVCGRLKLHFLCSAKDKELLRGKKGQSDLLLREGRFYLSVCVTLRKRLLSFLQASSVSTWELSRSLPTAKEINTPANPSRKCGRNAADSANSFSPGRPVLPGSIFRRQASGKAGSSKMSITASVRTWFNSR